MECIRSNPIISAHSSKDFKIVLKKMMQGEKKNLNWEQILYQHNPETRYNAMRTNF